MTSRALSVVILAAGKGTRMKSAQPKVLHPLAGRPLIHHVLRTAASLDAGATVVVIGHGAEQVRSALAASAPGVPLVVQSPQLGTAHAVLQAEGALAGRSGVLLVIYADVPMLEPNTLRRLVEHHTETGAAATVLTTAAADPYGYERIVRDADGQVARIVGEHDASAEERQSREINSGIYCFDMPPLFGVLHELAAEHGEGGEYFLTSLIPAYRRRGLLVESLCLDSPIELRAVHTRVDLAEITRVLRDRRNRALMIAGVTLDDPATAYVDADVAVGADTVIGPNVQLEGRTTVGARCRIGAGSRLTDATIGDDVTILDGCVIVSSTVAAGAQVGPYAHLRPASEVGEQARIGNFVELKKTRLGRGSKANHLAYLGDAIIGDGVNVGAGTITCNYDGEKKHQTILEDGVFVGSDSQLVAPVRVGKGAYVAAGSTVTHDVPADALAIGRARQENKPDWAARRRAQRKAERD